MILYDNISYGIIHSGKGIKMRNIKKIVLMSVLISLAVILSLFDKMITPLAFPTLPTAKIGFANIVILLAIIIFDFKDSMIIVILKSIIANLLFSGLTSFIIGGTASLVSYFIMYGLYKCFKNHLSAIGISVAGGFSHTVSQLFVVAMIYNLGEITLYYGALLVFVSLITSILIGVIVNKLLDYFNTKIEI